MKNKDLYISILAKTGSACIISSWWQAIHWYTLYTTDFGRRLIRDPWRVDFEHGTGRNGMGHDGTRTAWDRRLTTYTSAQVGPLWTTMDHLIPGRFQVFFGGTSTCRTWCWVKHTVGCGRAGTIDCMNLHIYIYIISLRWTCWGTSFTSRAQIRLFDVFNMWKNTYVVLWCNVCS